MRRDERIAVHPNCSQPLSLEASDIHVWHIGLRLTESRRDQLRASLSPAERARAERFAFEDGRARFIAAHGMLRTIISWYVSEPPKALRFTTGRHGKPALTGLRGAAEKLRFNLAHSDDAALIAIAHNREVGIDLERMRDDVNWQGLADRLFSPNECERLRRLSGNQATRLFFTLWTCKEACAKALGTGLSLDLNRCEVLRVAEERVAKVEWLETSGQHGDCLVQVLSLGSDYVGAVAAEGDDWRAVYRQIVTER